MILLKLKQKGLSLVESIIAIGVSMIVLTVIISFTLSLFVSSQRNYVKNSAVSFINILSNQIKLIELSLRYAVKEVNLGNTSFYPKNISVNVINNRNTWNWICSKDSNRYFFRLNNNFDNTNNTLLEHNLNFEYINNLNLINTPLGNLHFVNISSNELMGIFSTYTNLNNVNVNYSISRTFVDDSRLGELIVFDLVLSYRVSGVFNKFEYLGPSKIFMLRNQICLN